MCRCWVHLFIFLSLFLSLAVCAQHEFVLNPVSGKVRLTRSLISSPLRSLDSPRFLLDAELEHIDIQLTRSQYRQAMVLAETTQQYIIAWQRRKLRPTCSVHSEYVCPAIISTLLHWPHLECTYSFFTNYFPLVKPNFISNNYCLACYCSRRAHLSFLFM